MGKSTLDNGSCTIQCVPQNPCYHDGDPLQQPWCLNDDGSEQTCNNPSNCVGKSTLEPDGSGSCTIECVIPDPCYTGGDPNAAPLCQNTDGSEQTCINSPSCVGLSQGYSLAPLKWKKCYRKILPVGYQNNPCLSTSEGGSCNIQCVVPDPCYQGGDPSGTPWCQNTDGSEQVCNNPTGCTGKSTLEADGSGSCNINCVVEGKVWKSTTRVDPVPIMEWVGFCYFEHIFKLLKIPVTLVVIQVQPLFVKIQMDLSKYAMIMDA